MGVSTLVARESNLKSVWIRDVRSESAPTIGRFGVKLSAAYSLSPRMIGTRGDGKLNSERIGSTSARGRSVADGAIRLSTHDSQSGESLSLCVMFAVTSTVLSAT